MAEAGERAKAIALAARKLALEMGAESVIVMVGLPDRDTHSAYFVTTSGRCLQVRGLLETGGDALREDLNKGYDTVV